MSEASTSAESDFSAQMQALVIEAAQVRDEKGFKGDARSRGDAPNSAPQAPVAQLLRPLFMGMESLMRSQGTQSLALDRLEKVLAAHASIPEVLSDAKQSIEQRNLVNRAMFDALHAELKQYKDDYLLESVVRPIVRDLISLHDDAREILRQMIPALNPVETPATAAPGDSEVFEKLNRNLQHHVHYILEVLERLEVRVVQPHAGKLDKRNQKVVAREPAANEEEDMVVARSVRPGFQWRDRLFRPEEVVVKKWELSNEAPNDVDSPEPGPA